MMERKETTANEVQVEVPKGFQVSGIHHNPSWTKLRATCDELGVDHSGPDKVLRAILPISWANHRLGGGATRDIAALSTYRFSLAERERTLARLQEQKAIPLALETAEANVRSARMNVDRLEALVAAAGDSHLDDQLARRGRMVQTERELNETKGRLKLFPRGNQSKEVLELERLEMRQERAASKAAALFQSGREVLEKHGQQVQKLKMQFYRAAVACGETACRGLGERAADLVFPDLEFLAHAPHRLPPEIEGLFRQAGVLSDLMEKLHGEALRRGLAAFWDGCGEVAPIVAEGLGVQEITRLHRRPAPPELSATLDRELGFVS